jgi:hypothetical protein
MHCSGTPSQNYNGLQYILEASYAAIDIVTQSSTELVSVVFSYLLLCLFRSCLHLLEGALFSRTVATRIALYLYWLNDWLVFLD